MHALLESTKKEMILDALIRREDLEAQMNPKYNECGTIWLEQRRARLAAEIAKIDAEIATVEAAPTMPR